MVLVVQMCMLVNVSVLTGHEVELREVTSAEDTRVVSAARPAGHDVTNALFVVTHHL